ncbi:MAG: 2-oxo acid dehydrogenase subunit [Mucilaginibacter sp.]|nr:2-oxo acid dehydrogenase subunit [Mucilaginibacter sp.]
MAKYQLLLPKMGESVAEATIIKWNKNPGDYIEADDAVMEIATDKVDSEVPSPVSGKLVEQLCNENDVVQVGSVIAVIETEEEEKEENIKEPQLVAEQPEINTPEAPQEEPFISGPIPGLEQLEVKHEEEIGDGFKNSTRFYSPLVKNIATQEGISVEELDKIPGTGADGRLTKDDLLNYLQNPSSILTTGELQQEVNSKSKSSAPGQPLQAKQVQTQAPIQPPETKSAPTISVSGSDEIIEMDRMRRLIADHMVMSKHTSPHVTSFVEADVTNLVLWRENNKGAFEKKEGEKITFTPIFIEAVVRAIKDMPMVNVSVSGYRIIKKAAVNIGMATALPNGNLIVPVIKNADKLNLVGLTKSVNDLANRARNNKLQPDDVQDGTFTITNVGTFGNVMGTPIINQPQVAILAVGAIKKKPAVIETRQGDVIAIRHMMFLSLSYDHRVVDGALGGSFLRRVADYLEGWDLDRAI